LGAGLGAARRAREAALAATPESAVRNIAELGVRQRALEEPGFAGARALVGEATEALGPFGTGELLRGAGGRAADVAQNLGERVPVLRRAAAGASRLGARTAPIVLAPDIAETTNRALDPEIEARLRRLQFGGR